MSTYHEIVYWLTFIHESGLKLNVIKPIIQRWCVQEERPLTELFTLSPLEWATTFGLTEVESEQVQRLPDKLVQQATRLAKWQAQGIEPLIFTDPRYPQRLLEQLAPANRPLMLWVQGAIPLLNEANISILSNTSLNEAWRPFRQELAEVMVTEQISLVSGYGRGFERELFDFMLTQAENQVMAILPMGLSAFHQTTPKLVQPQNAHRMLLISPFTPDTPYQEKLAAARNLLIDHLAFATLALQPDAELQSRVQAAIGRGCSVFLRDIEESQAAPALFEAGALPLTDLAELVEMVQQGIIDAAMMAPEPERKLATIKESKTEDYSLLSEALEPLEQEETLRLLSTNGQLPPILRQRLGQP